jgi:hypothetical protein
VFVASGVLLAMAALGGLTGPCCRAGPGKPRSTVAQPGRGRDEVRLRRGGGAWQPTPGSGACRPGLEGRWRRLGRGEGGAGRSGTCSAASIRGRRRRLRGRLTVGGDGDDGGGLTSRFGAASQVAAGVAPDGGPHESGEGGAFGFGPFLGGVPDLVFDPGGPLRCGHTTPFEGLRVPRATPGNVSIIPCQRLRAGRGALSLGRPGLPAV